MVETFKPVEIREYYINRIASGMSKYFWDNIFNGIFEIIKGKNTVYNSFPNHSGRKGKVGGSLPKGNMPTVEDFKNPKKDYRLPDIPQNILDKLGKKSKPIFLKKNIIEKNKAHHPELTIEEYNEILSDGLYKTDVIFKTNSNDEYFNFVHYTEGSNSQVLIELSETKDNYEIVNFYRLRDKSLKDKLKKAIKRVDNEGDQFLIDIEGKASKVGGLSNLETDSIIIINYNNSVFNSIVNNSKDDLINAIQSGKIYYQDGAFRTRDKFSNAVASTLEQIGARYKNDAYYIAENLIPVEYTQALAIAQARAAAKLLAIKDFINRLDLSDVDLTPYIETAAKEMFKTLERDIVKSAVEKKIPVIELGLVSPKTTDIPAQTVKDIQTYWDKHEKKAKELNKALKESEKQGKDTADLKKQIEDLSKDAFDNAPKYEINDVALDEQGKKIAEDYTYNMQYWVKKWEAKNIVKMRKDVLDMVQKGYREPQIQEYFEQRWGIAKNKAAFLAKNESHLAGSVITKTQYEKLGCNRFKWGRSSAREKRKLHEEYYNKVYYFNDPPIIDEKLGIKGLPRQIWNCLCHMLVVRPTLAELQERRRTVKNSKTLLGKIRNAIQNSKQCNNNTWRYRRFGEGQAV